jgi:hypothetical protein
MPELVEGEDGAEAEVAAAGEAWQGDKAGIEGVVEEVQAKVAEAATIDDHQEVPDNAELVSVVPVASVVLVLPPVFPLDRNRNRSRRAKALVRPLSPRMDSRVDRSNILSNSNILSISNRWEGMTHPTRYLSIHTNQTHLNSLIPACNLGKSNPNSVIRPTPLNLAKVRCNGTALILLLLPRDMDNGPLISPGFPKAKASAPSPAEQTSASNRHISNSNSSNSSHRCLCPELRIKAQWPMPRLSTPGSRRSISRCSRGVMAGRGSRDRGTTTRNDSANLSGYR